MPTEIRFDTARYLDEPTDWPTGWKKWTPLVLLKIALYFAVCLVFLLSFTNAIFDPEVQAITFTIGLLGVWRYGWWFTHAIRASIYARRVSVSYTHLRAHETS